MGSFCKKYEVGANLRVRPKWARFVKSQKVKGKRQKIMDSRLRENDNECRQAA